MPAAAIKRRKVSAIQSASSLYSRPLDAFTRISKASSFTKSVIDTKDYVNTIATTQLKHTTSENNKRKVDIIEEEEEESAEDQISSFFAATIKDREIKPLPQRRSNYSQRSPHTPQKFLPNTSSPASSVETPTKGARNLLDRLHFSAETPTTRAAPLGGASNTPNLDPAELPLELLDLINLHSAFLTALSLHYAHNGTHSPADLRLLCPNVARVWGKRRVILEDIRRTLGVMNTNMPEGGNSTRESRLSLSDYGHGKICVEIRTGAGKAGRVARPVDENLLNSIFVQGLKMAWEEQRVMDIESKEFVDGLPLEPITTCSSLAKMSPLLARGQRRLEDLRAGIIIRKETTKEEVSVVSNSTGTRPTLLERLRAKQLEQSKLPPPPSKEEISRRAALQRIDEVVAVLSILSTSSSIGQRRISFTMPTVLGKLRDSFKTPMSKEEGDICIRLLASEIAPEWLKVVKMGKVEALVVDRDERPTELDIKERVKRAV